MIKVRELKGYKSLRALNTFHTLMLGLKMIPAYMGESYEDFLGRIKEMDEDGRTKMLREAVRWVPLSPEEVESMVTFCSDGNGVPYTAEGIKTIDPKRLIDCIVAVGLAIGRIECDILTEEEKKN